MTSSLPTLSEAFDGALSYLDTLYAQDEARKPLWPAPYDVLTPEAAYLWLTECWWTDNDADGLVELVPSQEFVRNFAREWVESFTARRPMWTEKSRRLVFSWMARGLETWVMGLSRGSWLIIDQTFSNAAEHLWRIDFGLNRLYDNRPELNLRRHEVRGAIMVKEPSHIILPNGSMMTASYQDAGATQGKGRTGITLEELSKYRAPTAFVGQALIVTQGKGESTGGWVCGICNASPNPDWHSIKPDAPDSNGKPRHIKAVELLDDPAHAAMQGFAAKTMVNGHRYLAVHYTCDQNKRGNWANTMKAGVPPREWEQEMELSEEIHSGKVVFETYNDERHSPRRYRGETRFPQGAASWFIGGWDCGSTMRPAFVLLQITRMFQVRCILEVTSEGNEPMSMFAPRVMAEVKKVLPGSWLDVIHVGDGTIRNRMGNTGKSAADIAEPILGQKIKAMSNQLAARQSAVTDLLMKTMKADDGSEAPRFVIDGGACPLLRGGFLGGYKYAQTILSDGSTTYAPEPVKNRYADPQDALQYAAQHAWRIIEGKSHGKISRRG